jgi:sugar/nucleoside kinase (ribokinase family)
MGSVGFPNLDPALEALKRSSKIICLAPPAHTDALEFEDGKIISSKLSSLDLITWANIQKQCSTLQMASLLLKCDLIVFSNWSMILEMNSIWRQFLEEVAPRINCQEKTVFFDLADPEKRTSKDLIEALTRIKAFHQLGFCVILSMNRKEACEISEALGLSIEDYKLAKAPQLATYLESQMNIDCVVIHPVDIACCANRDNYYEVIGPFCAHPKLTTGAGDNFNAGFLYGYMQNFPLPLCLLTGCATSGYYVRNAKSPTLKELASFVAQWAENKLED